MLADYLLAVKRKVDVQMRNNNTLLVSLVLLPVVAAGACRQSETNSSGVFRWKEVPSDAVKIVSDTTTNNYHDEDGHALGIARARLLARKAEWSYGTLSGPENTAWGWIRDVTTDIEGRIFAVDGLLNLMRVLSPDGELLAETFRAGEGPMEIRAPAGVEFLGDTLMMYSPFGFIYASGEPEDLTEVGRFLPEIPAGIEDVCIGGGRAFLKVIPFFEPVAVRTIDLDGAEINSFGRVFPHDSPAIRMPLSRGRIACIEDPRRIVTSFNDGSLIYSYSYLGNVEWVAHLEGFQAPSMVSESLGDDRSVVSRIDELPADKVQSLVSLPEGLILVQVNRMGPSIEGVNGAMSRKVRRRDSFVISGRTGASVYVGPGLPEILHVTDQRIFASETDVDLGHGVLTAYQW